MNSVMQSAVALPVPMARPQVGTQTPGTKVKMLKTIQRATRPHLTWRTPGAPEGHRNPTAGSWPTYLKKVSNSPTKCRKKIDLKVRDPTMDPPGWVAGTLPTPRSMKSLTPLLAPLVSLLLLLLLLLPLVVPRSVTKLVDSTFSHPRSAIHTRPCRCRRRGCRCQQTGRPSSWRLSSPSWPTARRPRDRLVTWRSCRPSLSDGLRIRCSGGAGDSTGTRVRDWTGTRPHTPRDLPGQT